MKAQGKLLPISFNQQLQAIISVEIHKDQKKDACFCWDELKDADVDIEIKKHRKKRSLDANAYCWVLIGKLSAKIGSTPRDIYRELIKDVGDNFYMYPLKNDAVERYCQIWESNGIGWQTDTIESRLDGYTNVMCYYGSSEYDSAQMWRLINLVIDECKEQNIPTEPPDKIEQMMSLYESIRQ